MIWLLLLLIPGLLVYGSPIDYQSLPVEQEIRPGTIIELRGMPLPQSWEDFKQGKANGFFLSLSNGYMYPKAIAHHYVTAVRPDGDDWIVITSDQQGVRYAKLSTFQAWDNTVHYWWPVGATPEDGLEVVRRLEEEYLGKPFDYSAYWFAFAQILTRLWGQPAEGMANWPAEGLNCASQIAVWNQVLPGLFNGLHSPHTIKAAQDAERLQETK